MGSYQSKEYDTTDQPACVWPDWMSHIPDSCSLASLSIPGSHSSMSFYGRDLIQCQSWALYHQYEAGIRFVDIRCRHFYNGLHIHHDVNYQYAEITHVLKESIRFLQENPREAILMRIREEYQPVGNTQTFDEAVAGALKDVGSSWFWKDARIPTMGEARGKIVILQDFKGPVMGVHYDGLNIADQWSVPTLYYVEEKWTNVLTNLEAARVGDCGTMYLTYSSGAGFLAYPYSVAYRVNPRVCTHLERFDMEPNRWGIIAMDFPGVELVHKIICSNLAE
ncbi:1-phosphatidylinositol phosphodiesterase-like [Latimeria chalumnae]|uniref:1-phosphatidylinositol phosphodiesterase-like n=1 Tax=Latimeria chalumnae TaxID=7897 RepID=UPI0006D8E2CE|nr:PREDICTED: 1-phosphatidylinositol phosphodiesterase-like [Latimeria chalumnae]|eukprot:XP_014348659.1 PREDICTED: 1-phosphatidylinositol phosphodiesterase-like [Latimeria chalumnae]